jgi:hypothetical protein
MDSHWLTAARLRRAEINSSEWSMAAAGLSHGQPRPISAFRSKAGQCQRDAEVDVEHALIPMQIAERHARPGQTRFDAQNTIEVEIETVWKSQVARYAQASGAAVRRLGS